MPPPVSCCFRSALFIPPSTLSRPFSASRALSKSESTPEAHADLWAAQSLFIPPSATKHPSTQPKGITISELLSKKTSCDLPHEQMKKERYVPKEERKPAPGALPRPSESEWFEPAHSAERIRAAAKFWTFGNPVAPPFPAKPTKQAKSRRAEARAAAAAAGTASSASHGRGARILYSANTFYDHRANEVVPEVLVLGRSNVGKSTMINALLGSSGMARVSGTPGYTKLVNAYGTGPPASRSDLRPDPAGRSLTGDAARHQAEAMRHSLVLLDTPGYGHNSMAEWGRHIDRLIESRRQLRGVVLLLPGDQSSSVPSPQDAQVLHRLTCASVPFLVVLTRIDRLHKSQVENPMNWAVAARGAAERLRYAPLFVERRSEVHGLKGGEFGADGRGRPLWDGGVYVTAAGMMIHGGTIRQALPLEFGMRAGVGGLRAAILSMVGMKGFDTEDRGGGRGMRNKQETERDDNEGVPGDTGDRMPGGDEDDIVPYEDIPVHGPR